jgi:hypothetical protein
MMKVASTSQTSVNFTRWQRNNPEDSSLHPRCCENLKFWIQIHFCESSSFLSDYAFFEKCAQNDHACLSVHMFQLENCWMDFEKIWYRYYAIGGCPKPVAFSGLQSVIPTWQSQTCEVGATVAPLNIETCRLLQHLRFFACDVTVFRLLRIDR